MRKIFNLEISVTNHIADFTIDLFDLTQNFIVESKMSCDFAIYFDSEVDGYIQIAQVYDSEMNKVNLPEVYRTELESLISKHVDFDLEYQERQIAQAEFLRDSMQDR